jgi:alkylation response protein AidB-like acyl-CoA dehydrogenase
MSVTGPPRVSALGEIADELRESVHAFVQARSPEPDVRRLIETADGFDPAVWSQMAAQLELPGMTIPERFGGSGFGVDAQAVVFEEMGAVLMCAPYLSTVLAAEAIVASGDDDASNEYLPAIAAGERRAALAVAERDGSWDAAGVTATAARDGDGWTIDGDKPFVIDGHTAHLLVVAARTPTGVGLFAVEGDAAGVSREAVRTLDLTRKQARVALRAARGRLLGSEDGAPPALAHANQRAAIALACESAGVAAACLEESVEYAKDRVQYGRAIGSFQAVKHKCAEMFRLAAQSRAAAYEAAVASAAGREDADLVASIAKAYCSEACSWVAQENIQVHGGIGYTWEHSAHLYFRRAKSNEQLFGSASYHRALVLKHLGL